MRSLLAWSAIEAHAHQARRCVIQARERSFAEVRGVSTHRLTAHSTALKQQVEQRAAGEAAPQPAVEAAVEAEPHLQLAPCCFPSACSRPHRTPRHLLPRHGTLHQGPDLQQARLSGWRSVWSQIHRRREKRLYELLVPLQCLATSSFAEIESAARE